MSLVERGFDSSNFGLLENKNAVNSNQNDPYHRFRRSAHRQPDPPRDPLEWCPIPDEPLQEGPHEQKQPAPKSAFLLLAAAGLTAWMFRRQIGSLFAMLDDLGARDPHSQLKGMMAYGITLVALLGFVRILRDHRR